MFTEISAGDKRKRNDTASGGDKPKSSTMQRIRPRKKELKAVKRARSAAANDDDNNRNDEPTIGSEDESPTE